MLVRCCRKSRGAGKDQLHCFAEEHDHVLLGESFGGDEEDVGACYVEKGEAAD